MPEHVLSLVLFIFGLLGLCNSQVACWKLKRPVDLEHTAFDFAFIAAAAVARYLGW